MTAAKRSLAAAEAQAIEARTRLSATWTDVQTRLDPKLLADEARDAGTAAAFAGIEQVRRNPSLVAGIASLSGLLLLGRQIATVRRRRQRRKPLPAQVRSTPSSTPPSLSRIES